MDNTTNDINWEKAYNDNQIKYKKLRKKLKKSKHKIKKLKAQRKDTYGREEETITKKIAKCKKGQNKRKQKVRKLEQKLHTMEMDLQKQQWVNENLKKQVAIERKITYLENQIEFSRLLLKEAVPGIVAKYGRTSKISDNGGAVIDAPWYKEIDISE